MSHQPDSKGPDRATPQGGPERPALRPRILLIEDNPDRLALFHAWLAPTQYLPVDVTSGGQALGMLRHGAEGVAGICLDHDLNERPRTSADEWVSGSDVVTLICTRVSRTVPVLVHSMNVIKAPGMVKRLQAAGLSVTRTRMFILNEGLFRDWLSDVDDSWSDRQEA